MSNLTKSYETAYFLLEPKQDVAFVNFTKDHLSEEDNINQLGFELMKIVEQHGFQKVIISMQTVEFLTSSVLGKMIRLHRQLQRSNGQLVLCDLTESVLQIMKTSRLNTFFSIQDDLESALTELQ